MTNTKTAAKTHSLRLAALRAELAEIANSDRSEGVKAAMTKCVTETLNAVLENRPRASLLTDEYLADLEMRSTLNALAVFLRNVSDSTRGRDLTEASQWHRVFRQHADVR
jgi:hypothetical protein